MTRRIFGKREALIEGKTIRFEMRVDGIWVWRKRSRRKFRVSFADLWQMANGQFLMKFD